MLVEAPPTIKAKPGLVDIATESEALAHPEDENDVAAQYAPFTKGAA